MKTLWRPALAAFGVVAIVASLLTLAASLTLSLRAEQAEATALAEQVEALRARQSRLQPRPERERASAPAFTAGTITLAGAALQQRIEAAAVAANARLVSSKVDVASHAAEKGLAISAELTMPEPAVQALLFDLENGRPYVFVDSFEARPAEGEGLRVSLNLSAQWSADR